MQFEYAIPMCPEVVQIFFQHSNSEVLKIKEIIEAWCVEDEYNFKQTFKDDRVCLEVHQY